MNRDEVLKAIKSMQNLNMVLSVTESERNAVNLAIAALQAQLNYGWISVEEGLPENPNDSDMEEYNVMIRGAKVPTSLTYTGKGKWWGDNYFYTVDYWQPLPKPPQKDKQ